VKNFKNLFLVVLMVYLIGFANYAFSEDDTEAFLNYEFASRHIFYGVDFLPNNHSINSFGFGVAKGEFFTFSYVAVDKDYSEWGCLLEYTFAVENLDFKTILFPFVWKFKGIGTDGGLVVGEEITIRTFLNPTVGYYYGYVVDTPELNGHYFLLDFSKDVLGIDWEIRLGYNKGFFIEDAEGFSSMLGISKTIELGKRSSVNLFCRYFWNDSDINENEIVFGISTTIKVF